MGKENIVDKNLDAVSLKLAAARAAKQEKTSTNHIAKPEFIPTDTGYDIYKIFTATGSTNGERYKTGTSLDSNAMKKFNAMLSMGGFNGKEKSELDQIAIELLYEIWYSMKLKNIDIFAKSGNGNRMDADDIFSKVKAHLK